VNKLLYLNKLRVKPGKLLQWHAGLTFLFEKQCLKDDELCVPIPVDDKT
jgi:hypothetical protein